MSRTKKKRDASKSKLNSKNSSKFNRRTDRCANPFNLAGHIGKTLQKISEDMLMKFSNLHKADKICFSCRKHDREVNPRPKKSRKNRSYQTNATHSQTINCANDANDNRSVRERELEQIFNNIKDKFSSLEKTDSLKVKLLTVAPDDWSLRKIVAEFDTTMYLASKSKQLKKANVVFGEVCKKREKAYPMK